MTFVQGIGLVQRCAKLCEYEKDSPYYKMAMRYIELAANAIYREVKKRMRGAEEGCADYNLLYAVVNRMCFTENRLELYWDLFLKRENVCE